MTSSSVVGHVSSIMVFVLLLLSPAAADIYLHNPAGSNNRNRERSANRNNANRLFDSQNNGKGGYAWQGDRTVAGKPDPMNYYVGSELKLEWTAQHGCGSDPTTGCQVIVQYACEDTMPGLRDGYPTGGLVDADNNNTGWQTRDFLRNEGGNNANGGQGTETISEQTKDDLEYGMHESFEYYRACQNRQRNKGLFTADQNLNGNGADKTRQNPNGQRHGFECPEERDYFPYWAPTPWRDAVFLVGDAKKECEHLKRNSRNVKGVQWCQMNDEQRQGAQDGKAPISEAPCTNAGGTWVEAPAWGTSAPHCFEHAQSRQNYLGDVNPNSIGGESGAIEGFGSSSAGFVWKIPGDAIPEDADSTLCVLRARYNITTAAFPRLADMAFRGSTPLPLDSSHNCKQGQGLCADGPADLAGGAAPLYQRPYVQAFTPGVDPELGIALNTNQSGRTFQDRSYVFKISRRPPTVDEDQRIVNVNVRGKRGNIVQAFPAVEYDFVPSELHVAEGAALHIQWTGSDFNPSNGPNNGEGWRFSDRSNFVQVAAPNVHFPLPATDMAAGGGPGSAVKLAAATPAGNFFFDAEDAARRFALLGQTGCGVYEDGTNNEQNAPDNCGKLNAAPAHFDGGIFHLSSDHKDRTYSFVSTRNNNFSNRGQKFTLTVHSEWSTWEIVRLVMGILLVLTLCGAVIWFGRQYFWAEKKGLPTSQKDLAKGKSKITASGMMRKKKTKAKKSNDRARQGSGGNNQSDSIKLLSLA